MLIDQKELFFYVKYSSSLLGELEIFPQLSVFLKKMVLMYLIDRYF